MLEERFADDNLTNGTNVRIFCGRGAVIENYGRISSYSSELFVLDSKQYRIILKGFGMDIKEISRECLVLDGIVATAEFEHENGIGEA